MRLLALISLAALCVVRSSVGIGEVCTEGELRRALAAGGTITFACDAFIEVTNTLQVTKNTILDAGTNNVTISGGGKVRVFEIADGLSFTGRNLKIVNGYHRGIDARFDFTTEQPHPGTEGNGGALAATNALLFLENCFFSNNVAKGGNDAGFMGPSVPGANASGGAIYVENCEVQIVGSKFVTNSAVPGAGILSVNFPDPTGSVGRDGFGGAIRVKGGALKVDGSEFAGNLTYSAGGAVAAIDAIAEFTETSFEENRVMARHIARTLSASTGSGYGGALYLTNSSAGITNSVFSRNALTHGGGYFWGGGELCGGGIYTDNDVSIEGSAFLGNFISGLESVHPVTNSAGGAIWVRGDALVKNTRFAGNSAIGTSSFTAHEVGPPGRGIGGAAFVGGTLAVSESSFVSNRVSGGMNMPWRNTILGGVGGAVYAGDALMTNVTVALNEVIGGTASELGGAVYLARTNLSLGSNGFHFCTIASNKLGIIGWTSEQGGPLATNQGWSQIKMNTNIAAAFRGTIVSGGSSNVIDGLVNDLGYNISSDGSFAASTSMNETDAMLGPVGIYGGGTETLPVLAGSPAIDAVSSGNFPAADQRGRARPYGEGVEVGAYELSAPFAVRGRIRDGIDLGAVTLTAAGEPVEVHEVSGAFLDFFESTGVLKPVLEGVVFYPNEFPLNAGVDVFNVSFTGYRLNDVVIEPGADKNMIVTFAAEAAGDYELQTSSNLATWSESGEVQTVPGNGLYRTVIAVGSGHQFFRVAKK